MNYVGLHLLEDLNYENMFQFECIIKLNECLKKYSIAMTCAFQVSHYIDRLFDNKVIQQPCYFNAFWDTFNKNLASLFSYCKRQFKKWMSLQQLTPNLILLN